MQLFQECMRTVEKGPLLFTFWAHCLMPFNTIYLIRRRRGRWKGKQRAELMQLMVNEDKKEKRLTFRSVRGLD